MATSPLKWLKRALIAISSVVALYLLAALIGSIFPANQSWQSPEDGIELFIETNGVHTGIIMPIVSDVHDWRLLVRPEHLYDPSKYGSHILVGWGHAGVYRNAEIWTDLRFRDAASATFGSSDVLLHIHHLNYPQAYPHYRRSLKVSEAEYRSIARSIAAQFEVDATGQPIPSPGYGTNDRFYEAHGRYNAFNSCNSWTGHLLKKAGIRTALWTPFSGGIMKWVPE